MIQFSIPWEGRRYKLATKFALEQLDIAMPDGKEFTFWFDGNGKVTIGHSSYNDPVANSFSLVQVQDCPFATDTCKSVCFVHNLEKAEAEVHKRYSENSITIKKILDNYSYQRSTEDAFASWIKQNCPKGFRWHVSGDVFSFSYAHFIRHVCLKSRSNFHWIYTRSFPYIEPLLGLSNLVVNLSADKNNWQEALKIHQKHGLRLCYLTVEGEIPDLPTNSVIFPSYDLRGRDLPNPTEAPWWKTLHIDQKRMVCPPDFFGQSEQHRCGPCKKCLLPQDG